MKTSTFISMNNITETGHIFADIFYSIKNKDTLLLKGLLSQFTQSALNININSYLLPDMIEDEKRKAELEDVMYYTPLYLATKLNNSEAIDLLLESGADVRTLVNEKNGLFASAYDLTVLYQNTELNGKFAQYVNQHNALANIKTKKRGENVMSFNFGSRKKRKANVKVKGEFQILKKI